VGRRRACRQCGFPRTPFRGGRNPLGRFGSRRRSRLPCPVRGPGASRAHRSRVGFRNRLGAFCRPRLARFGALVDSGGGGSFAVVARVLGGAEPAGARRAGGPVGSVEGAGDPRAATRVVDPAPAGQPAAVRAARPGSSARSQRCSISRSRSSSTPSGLPARGEPRRRSRCSPRRERSSSDSGRDPGSSEQRNLWASDNKPRL
jgi:hypothetical protein